MKKLSTILLLPFLIGSAFAEVQEKSYILELTNPDKPMSLDVELRNGNITVEGSKGKNVEIFARFTPLSEEELTRHHRHKRLERKESGQPENKPKRSREGLKQVQNKLVSLQIEEYDNEVEIESEFTNYSIDLVVKVPSTAKIDAELYSGKRISLTNLSGPIEVESYQGDIIATNISGPIVAETHKHDIVVTLSSLSDKSPSSLTTYNGDIDITLADKIKTTVNVQNYQGEIMSGLKEEFTMTDSEKRNKKGSRQKINVGGQLSAKVNGGGQHISLITYDGDVYVRKQ